jgi:phosphatidylglycerol:prolipoprotein diacylglycerol transferase
VLPFLVLGPLRIPTYGLMLAAAFIVGSVLIEQEFRRRGMGRNVGWDTVLVALVAGLVGSRINFILENRAMVARAGAKAVFGGSGMTWYGGFILALIAVLVFWRIRKVRMLPGLDTMAMVMPLAYAVGRIGCQLSGDGDYGKPSGLPWAMAYPHGTVPTLVRVHPTPVYETLLMTGFFFVLWDLRARKHPKGFIFALFLLGYGLERFLIEFIRTNEPVLAGLTEAQVMSVVTIAAGVVMLVRGKGRGESQHQETSRQDTRTPRTGT